MRQRFAAVTAAFAFASMGIACSSATDRSGFSGTENGATGSPDGGSGGNSLTGSGNNNNKVGDGGSSGVDTSGYNVPQKIGCSTRAQEILILDFRSGWWAGGGGGSFYAVALPAVVSACPGTSVDYHHFEQQNQQGPGMHVKCAYTTASGGGCQQLAAPTSVQDIRSSFQKASVSDYTQIWVLSGSDQDPSDIPVGNALFQGIVGDTTGACIPMLVAAGDGFVTHGNTVSNDLGMGAIFSQQTNPPSFFTVAMGQPVQAMSQAALTQHVLLTGVTSLSDAVTDGMQQAHGDGLAASAPAPAVYSVIAHDSQGRGAIAVGAAKLNGDAFRPFIFDSGWQRTYTIAQDPGVAQYLKNIVMYLSLVGCKAAPIAPPK